MFLWFSWLPSCRPGLKEGETYGIDVSHHQGSIDWRRVAADGITFAYIKATEGGDLVDHRFDANWFGADAAGIPRGAYHFFTLCVPGAVQAQNFLNAVPSDPSALPPAVDLELTGNCAARPSPTRVRAELTDFLDAVESATGRTALLYVRSDFESEYQVIVPMHRPLWVAMFLRRPSGTWHIWQVDSYARVDGIDTRVDLDVSRG